jgi:flagellar biosynthesis/type III secretory pathway chaperone
LSDEKTAEEEKEVDPKKIEKLEREKKELLASLSGGDFSRQKTKVAHVLNLYPESRNSDITLTIKYWETFQSDIYNPHGILPKDLFRLERMHYLVRARAKIQNEYNLFTPNTKVKRFRRKHEEEMNDAVLEDVKPRKLVHVYADETGKTQNYVVVSSVWVLTGRAVFTVSQAITSWQETSLWAKREVHFSKLGKKDLDTLNEYLGVIVKNREFLSFKSIAVEKARTKRSIEQVVEKLHEHMLLRGAEHDIENNRIGLPQKIEVTLDHEQSLDAITLDELKRRINDGCAAKYGEEVEVTKIETISSRNSPLVQLSDLVAGAINRKMNNTGEKNYKDEMADLVIHMLDLQFEQDKVEGLDVSALFKI